MADDAASRFTQLYERHYDQVERYVRRRADDSVVRDVVAEVFLVAWRRLPEVPTDQLPWLYGVARRVLANESRGSARGRQLVQRIAAHSDQASLVEADHADEVASRLHVAAAVDRLPEDDREVLRLAAWENLDSREAAIAMGCSAPAFAMRLQRARRRLRQELARSGGHPDQLAVGSVMKEGHR
jgi:RNA polymerase sigma factor (sigma-70 family)